MHVQIDPVALRMGGVEVRWYGILFVGGLAVAWLLMRSLARSGRTGVTRDEVDAVMFWISIAAVVGGRSGDLIFYRPGQFLVDPSSAFDLIGGGMSFHGGLIAIGVAIALFAHFRRLPFLALCDVAAAATPAGLGLGRIGNFLNGELYGPETRLPWGIALQPGLAARHPTQLYEAGLEGLLLLALLYPAARWGPALRYRGLVTGAFLCGYAAFRGAIDPLRTDDDPLVAAGFPITVAQALCLFMALTGASLLARAWRVGRDRQSVPADRG